MSNKEKSSNTSKPAQSGTKPVISKPAPLGGYLTHSLDKSNCQTKTENQGSKKG